MSDHIRHNLAGLSLLVIDDNEAILWSLSAVLSSCGAEVMTATGNEYDLIYDHPFNAILLDFQMPGIDGWDVIKAIRSHPSPKIRNLLVIAVTAKASKEDEQKIMQAGCDFYIRKPVNFPDLLSYLEKVAFQKRQGDST